MRFSLITNRAGRRARQSSRQLDHAHGAAKLGRGTLTLRTMLSFEPPHLTAALPEFFNREKVRTAAHCRWQHPHDFFMNRRALRLPLATSLSHCIRAHGRSSDGRSPIHTALSHRRILLLRSVTISRIRRILRAMSSRGLTYRKARVEASGFHGREPDEHRWNIDPARSNSWATRVTIAPAANWTLQILDCQLHSPEAIAPEEDIRRMTASIMYNRPLHNGNWASLLLWDATKAARR